MFEHEKNFLFFVQLDFTVDN